MDAAPAQDFHGRGAPRLLRHFAALELLAQDAGPSGRTRLEREVGGDLAALLLGALVRPAGRDEWPVSLCA